MNDVIRLENSFAEIVYKVERIFSPSFVTVMERLPIHLQHELRVGEPQQYRWTHPKVKH